MANDTQFHKVRWHVTAKGLGVSLPPGYHMLEAPLQLFLYYGDQEIAHSSVANTLASRRMADAVHLMQWMRDVIFENGLGKNPLAVRRGEDGDRRK